MDELSDGDAPKPAVTSTPSDPPAPTKRKRKKYKDPRRRPPSGFPSGQPFALTDVQINQIRDAMLGYVGRVEIIQKFSAKFGVDPTTIRKAFVRVEAAWAAEHKDEIEARRVEHRERLQGLIRDAREAHRAGDDRIASNIPRLTEQLHKIDGVYQSQKIEHSGAVGMAFQLGDMREDQIRARIDELLSKHVK